MAIGTSMLTLIVLACTCGPLTQLQNLRGQANTAEAFATELNVGVPTIVAGLTEVGPTLEAQLTEVAPTVEAQLTESAPTLEAVQTQAGDLLPTLMAGLTEIGPTIEAGLGGDIHQWASQATASSEFGNDGYSASQATGAPDTTDCGDASTAWASAAADGKDWLQLTYDTPVVPKQIEIHQSFNPGAITQVEVASQSAGQSQIVYQADPAVVNTCPFTLVVQVNGIDSKIDEITITVDQTNHNGRDEVDAVELIGTP
jgi:hypothetical protein